MGKKSNKPGVDRATKFVYDFSEGDASQKSLLGGKGANLAEMTNLGLPVPPGFTITTEACNAYYAAGKQLPPGLWVVDLPDGADGARVVDAMGGAFPELANNPQRVAGRQRAPGRQAGWAGPPAHPGRAPLPAPRPGPARRPACLAGPAPRPPQTRAGSYSRRPRARCKRVC